MAMACESAAELGDERQLSSSVNPKSYHSQVRYRTVRVLDRRKGEEYEYLQYCTMANAVRVRQRLFLFSFVHHSSCPPSALIHHPGLQHHQENDESIAN